MRICFLFALVLAVMPAVAGCAHSGVRRDFFFSAGQYGNIFTTDSTSLTNSVSLEEYSIVKLGGHMDFPLRVGSVFLGLETGYSSGDSLYGGQGGVDLVPMALTTAYAFPLIKGIWSIGPGLKLGGLGLKGNNWFDMVLTAGARLETELAYPHFPLSLYAAAGFDAFPAAHDPGLFPTAEIGLRLSVRFPRARPDAESPLLDYQDTQANEYGTGLPEIFQNPGELINPVFFEPDTAILIETSRAFLEATGRFMATNPSLRIHLRAYTAPFGFAAGRLIVSEARANFCRDYLMQSFGIVADRITIELIGSERAPAHVTDDWASYRCVELIVY